MLPFACKAVAGAETTGGFASAELLALTTNLGLVCVTAGSLAAVLPAVSAPLACNPFATAVAYTAAAIPVYAAVAGALPHSATAQALLVMSTCAAKFLEAAAVTAIYMSLPLRFGVGGRAEAVARLCGMTDRAGVSLGAVLVFFWLRSTEGCF